VSKKCLESPAEEYREPRERRTLQSMKRGVGETAWTAGQTSIPDPVKSTDVMEPSEQSAGGLLEKKEEDKERYLLGLKYANGTGEL